MSRADPSLPRISLLLLAHNQQCIARQAAHSCLAQECEPLEIVLSDDASSDNTFAELHAAAAGYRGPHRVRVRRNDANLGIGGHFNRLLAETSGDLLVTAAGDDLSTPDRVRRLAQAWDACGQRVDLIASHYIQMTLDGRPVRQVQTDDLSTATFASWLVRKPFTVGATHAFTRRMMDRFGPFVDGVCYEDNIMLLRALCGGGALTVNAPLVHYRQGGLSSGRRVYTAEQMVRWHRDQNRLRIAEVEQLIRDARLAGYGDAVTAALAATRTRENYRHALIVAPDNAARLRLLLHSRGIPLRWRLRKFIAMSLPSQAAAMKRIVERLIGSA